MATAAIRREAMKRCAVIAGAVAALAAAFVITSYGQGRGAAVPGTAARRDRELLQGDAVNGPVPRLADGHPDFTGPWKGGGSDADIEREGGLKPGELVALMLPWAKELRAK